MFDGLRKQRDGRVNVEALLKQDKKKKDNHDGEPPKGLGMP